MNRPRASPLVLSLSALALAGCQRDTPMETAALGEALGRVAASLLAGEVVELVLAAEAAGAALVDFEPAAREAGVLVELSALALALARVDQLVAETRAASGSGLEARPVAPEGEAPPF